MGPQRKLEEALQSLALNLHEHDRLNLEEAFVDATFTSTKGELSPSLAPLPQQGEQDHRYCHLYRVFLSPSLSKAPVCPSASLGKRFLPGASSRNVRLIGDKAYDLDPLEEKLASEYGIELIVPNPRGRKRRTRADAAAPL